MTYLFIAGHGKKRNGSFDSGATGFIKQGEHKYFTDTLFPLMKKYVPENEDVIFHTEYNVYDYRNLTALSKKYGNDTKVVEFHYDASSSSSASGGHVIIHSDYAPDSIDLKIRNVIDVFIGVRYSHKGHKGISGRNNLYNCNVARQNNINYRLIELGFGTSKKDTDIMMNKADEIAKALVEAITGNYKTVSKPKPKPETVDYDSLVKRTINGEFGNGSERKKNLGKHYDEVQRRINNQTESVDYDQLVKDTINGKYGNGVKRKQMLGKYYDEVQKRINKMF